MTVGRVLGTDESTPLEFWVAVAPGQHLQLDDVIAVDRILPDGERVAIYGIVGQVRARHEGARFDSDVFLIADGILPAEVVEAAQVQVTRVVPETFVPPLPGAEVRRAVDAERDEALDLTTVEHKVPAGLTRDGQPVVLDLDFIDGTKGAHINISGISGVATKTSYATFLLYSMLTSGVLGPAATNTRLPDLQRQGRGPAVPRPPQHPTRRGPARQVRTAGVDGGAIPLGARAGPAPARRPQRDAGDRRPHGRGPPPVLDDQRVLRRRAAAVPLRRRRGRAPAVPDRRPGRRRPAAPARPGQRRAAMGRCASTAPPCERSASSCAWWRPS